MGSYGNSIHRSRRRLAAEKKNAHTVEQQNFRGYVDSVEGSRARRRRDRARVFFCFFSFACNLVLAPTRFFSVRRGRVGELANFCVYLFCVCVLIMYTSILKGGYRRNHGEREGVAGVLAFALIIFFKVLFIQFLLFFLKFRMYIYIYIMRLFYFLGSRNLLEEDPSSVGSLFSIDCAIYI